MKRLWINGDSHTYGSYGPTPQDRVANPFAEQIADRLDLEYKNIALPGGSNQRIVRTTIEELPFLKPREDFILIGWTSWERTEWWLNNHWNQICGDPGYAIPHFYKDKIKSGEDYNELWRCSKEQEHSIWVLHKLLDNLGFRFLFYLACAHPFHWKSDQHNEGKAQWKINSWAHDPYAEEGFSYYSESQGYQKDSLWHYGQEAHNDYADVLLPIVKRNLGL